MRHRRSGQAGIQVIEMGNEQIFAGLDLLCEKKSRLILFGIWVISLRRTTALRFIGNCEISTWLTDLLLFRGKRFTRNPRSKGWGAALGAMGIFPNRLRERCRVSLRQFIEARWV